MRWFSGEQGGRREGIFRTTLGGPSGDFFPQRQWGNKSPMEERIGGKVPDSLRGNEVIDGSPLTGKGRGHAGNNLEKKDFEKAAGALLNNFLFGRDLGKWRPFPYRTRPGMLDSCPSLRNTRCGPASTGPFLKTQVRAGIFDPWGFGRRPRRRDRESAPCDMGYSPALGAQLFNNSASMDS